jgi:hypothetical protein
VEWRLALSSKRDLAVRVVAPLSVVLVIATGAFPAVATAAVYTMLFVVFSMFGTALPVLHDGERGIMLRVVRAGVSPASYLVQRAGAGATLALVQLLPAALVAMALLDPSSSEVVVALGALAISLWIGGLLGVVTAALSRTRTEAALLCGVGLVLLLHMSGVFRAPSPDGPGAVLESVSPFRALHEAFDAMAAGGAVGGAVAAAAWALVLPVVVSLVAPRLTASLERSC